MTSRDDKIALLFRRLPSRLSGKADRVDCPKEEKLADLLAGNLENDARAALEAHLAQCSFCTEDLVAAYKAGELAGMKTVPQRLIDSAMALIQARETLFDLVVRLARGSIELIRTTARVIAGPAPALRGEAKPAARNALQVEQEVGRFRVAVELDLRETGTCQVIANVREETGEPAEGVRLSLTCGEREQASFLTRGGVVVFDSIAPGEYSIAISESGALVGRIKLSLIL